MSTTSNESAVQPSIFSRMIPGLLLGFLVLLGLILVGDLRQVSHVILSFNWRIFPLAILLTLINYFLRFLKWHFYLKQIGIHQLPWVQSLRLFVAGFPLAMTPGKVGEVFKGVWLNQRTGIPVGRGVSVVVAERISDGLAVLLLSTFGVFASPRYWPAFLVMFCILIGVIVFSQIRPVAYWFLRLAERIVFVKRYVPALQEFYEGSFTLFRPGAVLLAVGLGTISWLGEGIGFYLILLGLGFPPGIPILGLAVFSLSFSTIIGAVSTLPGGLGAAEASIAGMLTLLGGFEPALAASATVLIRLATLWFGVALGLSTWVFSPDLLGLRHKHVNVVKG